MGVLGATSTTRGSAARRTALADQYSTVVDVVDEGADPTGDESITDLLESLPHNDALLQFPEGRYRMNHHYRNASFENFGMVGPNATIVPDDYGDFNDSGGTYWLFRLGTPENPGRDLHVSGFDIDQTAANTGVRAFDTVVSDGVTLRNIDVRGRDDLGSEGPLRVAVKDRQGTGVVEGFRAPDGSVPRSETPNQEHMYMGTTGIMANYPHHGTLTFRDCEVNHFSATGLYATYGGEVKVRGGRYANSETAQIRVGGRSSIVEFVTVEVDQHVSEFINQRGIRVEDADGITFIQDVDVNVTDPNGWAICVQEGVNDLRLRRADVDVSGDQPAHGIVVTDEVEAGLIDNCHVNLETPGGYGVWVRDSPHDSDILVEQTEIVGDAGTEAFGAGLRCDRDNVEFRKLRVDQTSDDYYRGGLTNFGDDCLYYDCEFRAEYHPVVEHGQGTWMESVYANSYSDQEALRFGEPSGDILLKESTLVGGIEDHGVTDLRGWGNEYSA